MTTSLRRFARLLLVVAGLAGCVRPAFAQVTLTIDPNTETYTWTGSYSASVGGGHSDPGEGYLIGGDSTGASMAFGVGGLTITGPYFDLVDTTYDGQILVGTSGFSVHLASYSSSEAFGTGGLVDFSGTSESISFAGADSPAKTLMLSLNGATIKFYDSYYNNFADAGTVSVLAVIPPTGGSAVPEPSTYAALAGAAALGLAVWRRRRATAA